MPFKLHQVLLPRIPQTAQQLRAEEPGESLRVALLGIFLQKPKEVVPCAWAACQLPPFAAGSRAWHQLRHKQSGGWLAQRVDF